MLSSNFSNHRASVRTACYAKGSLREGIGESAFAYTTGTPTVGADGKYQVNLAKVVFGRAMSEDEVDLDAGLLIVPSAASKCGSRQRQRRRRLERKRPPGTPTTTTIGPGPGGSKPGGATSARTHVRVTMTANRDEVFKAFKALANLSEKSDGGKISLVAEGQASEGYDSNWLRQRRRGAFR